MPTACGLIFFAILLWPVISLWCLVTWFLRRFRFGRSQTFRLIWVGIPLLGIPFVVAVIGAYLNRASAVYYYSFGEWPTADIRFIEKENGAFGDVGSARLVFYASPETYERLRRQIPPPPESPLDMPDGRHGWGHEEDTLTYDPGNGIATYLWRGVD